MFSGYVNKLKIYADVQELPDFLYNKTPGEFYNFMSLTVPYKEQVFEDVSRKPFDIIRYGGDCGEKTKCCMIYFRRKNIKFDLVFQQTKNGVYHIFPRMYKDNQFIDYDTSYGVLKMGQRFMFDSYQVTV